MRAIPVNGELPHQLFNVQLDGATYGLELRWNQRALGWFLSIFDVSGNLLLSGRRLVVGWGLIARFKKWNASLPPGDFIVVDSTGEGLEPGLDELGTRVKLVYIEAQELSA